MNTAEAAVLRAHYEAEGLKRVSIVEGLTVVIQEAEAEMLEQVTAREPKADPDYLEWVADRDLKSRFAYRKNVARRERLREEAKMFLLAAEALRP